MEECRWPSLLPVVWCELPWPSTRYSGAGCGEEKRLNGEMHEDRGKGRTAYTMRGSTSLPEPVGLHMYRGAFLAHQTCCCALRPSLAGACGQCFRNGSYDPVILDLVQVQVHDCPGITTRESCGKRLE